MRSCFLSLILCFFSKCFAIECKFVILICSYNNEQNVERNILSAINQKYKNFRIIYVDDGSKDKTVDVLNSVLDRESKKDLVTIFQNEKNLGAPLPNHYNIITNYIQDDEICVLLDGDDELSHPGVLCYLNKIYNRNDKEIWLTYGQFKEIKSKNLGFCCEYPIEIKDKCQFRSFVHMPSHLKTFYAWLFKKIKIEDLMYEGNFFKMTGDLAIMLPMIEMAKNHYEFIPHVLYMYNDTNEISEHKKSFEYQMFLARYIRSLTPYQPLD